MMLQGRRVDHHIAAGAGVGICKNEMLQNCRGLSFYCCCWSGNSVISVRMNLTLDEVPA